MQAQSFGWRDLILANIVLAIAVAVRVVYVNACMEDLQQPPPFQVQDRANTITLIRGEDRAAGPVTDVEKAKAIILGEGSATGPATDRDALVNSVIQSKGFACQAPLASEVEDTAHIAPGYPSLVGYLVRWLNDPDATTQTILWIQCALGALTAVIYLLFARLAFGSALVAFLAGLLAALHPFWIVNVAELQDGTLASFLLAACLFLGTLAAQRGSPLASVLFGGSLAGLVLVRAALLPFGFVALLWFLLRCRRLPRGWICGLLMFLGFGNGLAPWTVRNYQVFGQVVPVADSMYLHLWIGNNVLSRGGPQDEKMLENSLYPTRVELLKAEQNQARRYRMLADDWWQRVKALPAQAVEKRMNSGLCFVFGREWFLSSNLSRDNSRDDIPAWIVKSLPVALPAMLLGMLVLGLIGWRWSCGLSQEANLASLAMLWIPLPYILSHAEHFSGPRLPLDGVLLCYAALAIGWVISAGRALAPSQQTAQDL